MNCNVKSKMKLFSVLAFSAVSADWVQPAWRDVQSAMNSDGRNDLEWGAPVGVKGGRKWSDCPAIDASAIFGTIRYYNI